MYHPARWCRSPAGAEHVRGSVWEGLQRAWWAALAACINGQLLAPCSPPTPLHMCSTARRSCACCRRTARSARATCTWGSRCDGQGPWAGSGGRVRTGKAWRLLAQTGRGSRASLCLQTRWFRSTLPLPLARRLECPAIPVCTAPAFQAQAREHSARLAFFPPTFALLACLVCLRVSPLRSRPPLCSTRLPSHPSGAGAQRAPGLLPCLPPRVRVRRDLQRARRARARPL